MSLKQMMTLTGVLVAAVSLAAVLHAQFVMPAMLGEARIYARQVAAEAVADSVRRPELQQILDRLDRLTARFDRFAERQGTR